MPKSEGRGGRAGGGPPPGRRAAPGRPGPGEPRRPAPVPPGLRPHYAWTRGAGGVKVAAHVPRRSFSRERPPFQSEPERARPGYGRSDPLPETLEPSLRIAVDALPVPAWTADSDGRVTHVNGSWTAATGLDVQALHGPGWPQAAGEEEREALGRGWAEALRAGVPFEAEARLGAAEGARWHRVRAAPARGPDGRIAGWLGTCTDIEAEKSLDETRQALAREMNHRVKNLFAVASGLVSMTARTAKTPKDMADALRGRLGALSRAHELVRSSAATGGPAGQGTSLGELIRAVLAPYAQEGPGDRLVLRGPAITVGSGVVTNLALVLHELSTNAAKYGALSSPRVHTALR